jgi:hypothetical protein
MKIVISAIGKLYTGRVKLAAAIVAVTTLLSFAPAARAVSYTSTPSPTLQFSLDPLSFISASTAGGTIGSNQILLTNLAFFATGSYAGTFTDTVTIGNGPGATASGNLTIPFSLNISSLTVAGGETLSLLVGSSLWTIVVDGFTIVSPGVASLYAQVSESPAATPLPAALVLFGSGLGAMGLFARRRKRQPSAILAA